MTDAIIVVNAGSTSLKFGAYAMDASRSLPLLCRGQIDGMQDDPHFVAKNAAGKPIDAHEWGEGHAIDHKTALHFVITWLEANIADMKVVAAGHRIVLGGTRFEAPVRIDDDVLAYLDSLVAMEPSHQPYNVRGARALAEAFPGLPQVACFDTSFHRTMPEVAQTYALPKDVRDAGVRHWGYHGISYDYISRQVPKFAPEARRVIVAHLGGGASMCAMLDGHSVETTMGFAGRVRPADGDALGRRAAGRAVLPAAPQAVRRRVAGEDAVRALGPARPVRHQRRHAGVAGERGSARDRGSGVFRLRDDEIRRRLCGCARRAGRLRVHRRHWRELRPGARGAVQQAGVARREAGRAGERFQRPAHLHRGQQVSVWVIPTDEELMIAQHTLALIRPSRS